MRMDLSLARVASALMNQAEEAKKTIEEHIIMCTVHSAFVRVHDACMDQSKKNLKETLPWAA